MGCSLGCCRLVCSGPEPLLDAQAVLQALRDPDITSINAMGKAITDRDLVDISTALLENRTVTALWIGNNLHGRRDISYRSRARQPRAGHADFVEVRHRRC